MQSADTSSDATSRMFDDMTIGECTLRFTVVCTHTISRYKRMYHIHIFTSYRACLCIFII